MGYDTQKQVLKEHQAGIFWISWEDLQDFFAGIESSWSPARFNFRRDMHGHWRKTVGQHHSTFSATTLDDNPQYILRVTAASATVVWLVLFQHYPPNASAKQTPSQPSQALKLALHTFKGNRKAYYIADEHLKSPWKVVYNEQYASVRLTCPRGDQAFVIVIAADKSNAPLAYTLT